MSYSFFDHTADVLFEAEGKTLEEMFESAALATEETQVKLEDVKHIISKRITVENKDIEMLLFDFLQELIFYKDAEELLFSKFDIKINGNELECEAWGEKINFKKHTTNVDVKAVTLHQFEVKQENGIWKARVILDI